MLVRDHEAALAAFEVASTAIVDHIKSGTSPTTEEIMAREVASLRLAAASLALSSIERRPAKQTEPEPPVSSALKK
jgi:hypothetical protein